MLNNRKCKLPERIVLERPNSAIFTVFFSRVPRNFRSGSTDHQRVLPKNMLFFAAGCSPIFEYIFRSWPRLTLRTLSYASKAERAIGMFACSKDSKMIEKRNSCAISFIRFFSMFAFICLAHSIPVRSLNSRPRIREINSEQTFRIFFSSAYHTRTASV